MKSATFFPVILILVLFLSACSNVQTVSTPSVILFADDFSSTGGDWGRYTDDSYSTDFFNNAYRIIVNEADIDVWSYPKSKNFADVQIEVDATMNGGPEDNILGVICRYLSEDEFYYAVISSDGYYGILKKTGDGGFILGEDYLLESNRITQGLNTNHIRFDCVGSDLTLYINGYKLGQQSDSDYANGSVGLLAGTYEIAGTDVIFDNFFVYKP